MSHPYTFRKRSARRTGPASRQKGLSLIEALVALMVLALGVLGLAAVQTRMLIETRITNSRATAVRLISDLSERVQLNKAGAQPPVAPALGVSAYQSTDFSAPPTARPASACDMNAAVTVAGACTPAARAAFDVWEWRRAVANALLDGRATITQDTDPRHLRVVVAWRLNEKENSTLANQLRISFGGGTGDQCPANFICHMDYIEIPVDR